MSRDTRRRRHRRHDFSELPTYRPRRRERQRDRKRRRRLAAWSRYRPVVLTAAATVVFLSVAAVIWTRDSSDLDLRLTQAMELHQQGEFEGAASTLKNLLVRDPNHIGARWELGQVLISREDGAAALKELEKAESLGFRHPQLFSSKLVALLLDGQFTLALRQLAFVSDLDSNAVLLEIQARAQLGLGHADEARATLEKVVEKAPERAAGHLWLGRVALRQGDLTLAMEQVDALVSAQSPSAEAWVLKGEVDLVSEQSERAEIAFRAALEDSPSNVPAKLGLARALLLQSRPEPAEKYLSDVLELAPDHPLATFLLAHANLQRGADDSAVEHAQDVISRYPKHPPTLLLLGTLYTQRGDLARAELLLRRLVAGDPDHVPGQKLLAGVEIQSGAAASAATRLEHLRELAPNDGSLVTLLAAAYTRSGRGENALELIASNPEETEGSAALNAELGFAHLSLGNLAAGFDALEHAIELDSRHTRAYLLLAVAHLETDQAARARDAMLQLLEHDKTSVPGWHLLGVAQLAVGDARDARASLDSSLALDGGYVPALWSLARLDQAEALQTQARARYQAILRLDPNHVGARYELALLEIRANRQQAAVEHLRAVLAQHPAHRAALHTLVGVHLRNGQLARAEQVTDAAWRTNPDAEVTAQLADLMVASGNYPTASKVLAEAPADTPNPIGLAARARIVAALLDPSPGQLASPEVPNQNGALDREARLMARGSRSVAKGELLKAHAIARDLARQFPASASAETLRGDVFEREGKHPAALAAFENAYRLDPSPGLLKRIVAGWSALGDPDHAVQFLDARVQQAPNDLTARGLLGDLMLGQGQLDDARDQYEELLREQPANAIALNNLAWIYYRQDDARALRMAEDAYRIAGKRAAVADTYGWLLVEVGQADRGREILEQAYAQAPDDAYIRYHLAVALARTEARPEARKLLIALREDNPNFTDRDAALALLAMLEPLP